MHTGIGPELAKLGTAVSTIEMLNSSPHQAEECGTCLIASTVHDIPAALYSLSRIKGERLGTKECTF